MKWSEGIIRNPVLNDSISDSKMVWFGFCLVLRRVSGFRFQITVNVRIIMIYFISTFPHFRVIRVELTLEEESLVLKPFEGWGSIRVRD